MTACLFCGTEAGFSQKYYKNGPRLRKYCSTKCIKAYYRLQNPVKDKLQKEKWITNYPERRKISSRKYQIENKSYYAAYSAAYRVRKSQQTFYLNEFEKLWLAEIYD